MGPSKTSKIEIEVLLATYNGEAFLPELLDSLLWQTFKGWRCLVRDDGSSDSTLEILKKYRRRHPDRFIQIGKKGANLGARGSFAALLEKASADYVMFCDQDDIWLQSKMERSLEIAVELEARYGTDRPVLVHSDLQPVDENLRPLSDSFWRYQNLHPQTGACFSRLLVQNCVTGNTILMNRAAVELCRPIPPQAIMHDWWAALCVAAFGTIGCLHQATILYRQHGKNQIGAKEWSCLAALSGLSGIRRAKTSLKDTMTQAQAFWHRFKDHPSKEVMLAKDYSRIHQMRPAEKRFFLWKNKIFKTGFARNAGLFLLI